MIGTGKAHCALWTTPTSSDCPPLTHDHVCFQVPGAKPYTTTTELGHQIISVPSISLPNVTQINIWLPPYAF